MVLKARGLTKTWNPAEPFKGYTDNETVMLDFDDTTFKNVKYWACRTMRWFKLGGFVILKSSENNYHVVFNRSVSWSRNMHVVSWVSLESGNRGLLKWLQMQCIKESSTLRVSAKKEKLPPRIVYRFGEQDKQIQSFLHYRKIIKNIVRIYSE